MKKHRTRGIIELTLKFFILHEQTCRYGREQQAVGGRARYGFKLERDGVEVAFHNTLPSTNFSSINYWNINIVITGIKFTSIYSHASLHI